MIYRGFPYQHEAQRALFKKTESTVCRFFIKKSFGKFRNVFRNAPVLQPVLTKVQTAGLQSYYQKPLAHLFFCGSCKISQNNFFTKHQLTTSSKMVKSTLSTVPFFQATEANWRIFRK